MKVKRNKNGSNPKQIVDAGALKKQEWKCWRTLEH